MTPRILNGAPRFEVWQGDVLRVLPELAEASVDMIVTDPPYSSGGQFRGDRVNDTNAKYISTGTVNVQRLASFAGDNRDQRGYLLWSALWMGEALRVVKPGGLCCVFTDWRQLPTTIDALQAGGWVWRGVLPWYKPVARPALGKFANNCEYVVWGSAGAMPTEYVAGGKAPRGFYQESAPNADTRQHPTQKPVGLMHYLFQLLPDRGGVVLDPFLGSGTTGVAVAQRGKGTGFVGVELTEHYAGMACDNIRAQLAQGGLFADAPDVEQGELFTTAENGTKTADPITTATTPGDAGENTQTEGGNNADE